MTASWGATFSPAHPLDSQMAHETWTALLADGAPADIGRRLAFVRERPARADRWDTALASRTLHLIWGTQDIVSGSDAGLVPERLPDARLVALEDLGHAPHLEDPDRVGPHTAAALDPTN